MEKCSLRFADIKQREVETTSRLGGDKVLSPPSNRMPRAFDLIYAPVQRSSSQAPLSSLPRSAGKLSRSAAPPLPFEPASLGFKWIPVLGRSTFTGSLYFCACGELCEAFCVVPISLGEIYNALNERSARCRLLCNYYSSIALIDSLSIMYSQSPMRTPRTFQ